MKLYVSKMTPNPRRVLMFLAEKGVLDQFELVDLQLATDAKADEHLARNRLGKVPVLELPDGRHLSESRAICQYLEALHPEPNLMGATPEERAFFEMHDRHMELEILFPIANWVRHGHPGLSVIENPQVPDWSKVAEGKARAAMVWLDDDLSGREFIAGNRFSIADITCFVALEFARLMKFRPWEEYPNIARWREAVQSRPSSKVN
jgi:glutathione S-transferase